MIIQYFKINIVCMNCTSTNIEIKIFEQYPYPDTEQYIQFKCNKCGNIIKKDSPLCL